MRRLRLIDGWMAITYSVLQGKKKKVIGKILVIKNVTHRMTSNRRLKELL
jgi:hypothetical protein